MSAAKRSSKPRGQGDEQQRGSKPTPSPGFFESIGFEPTWIQGEFGPASAAGRPAGSDAPGQPSADEYEELERALDKYYVEADPELARERQRASARHESPETAPLQPPAPVAVQVDAPPAAEETAASPTRPAGPAPNDDPTEPLELTPEIMAAILAAAGRETTEAEPPAIPPVDESEEIHDHVWAAVVGVPVGVPVGIPDTPAREPEPPMLTLDDLDAEQIERWLAESESAAVEAEQGADEIDRWLAASQPEPDTTDRAQSLVAEPAPAEPAEAVAPPEAEAPDEATVAAEPEAVVETDLLPEPATADTFIVDDEPETDDLEAPYEPAVAQEPVAEEPRRARRVKAPKKPKEKQARRGRLSPALLLMSVALFVLAALIYFINPFGRIALSTASMARPSSASGLPAPASVGTNWCVTGEFLADGAAALPMADNGSQGDILEGDGIFVLEQTIAQPGSYNWWVHDCGNPNVAYPPAAAWLVTGRPNERVTFVFNGVESADPLFFPIPYVVSVDDDTTTYRVVGSFQDWQGDDPSGQMQRVGAGVYQLVRRIARPGTYEAYIISNSPRHAVDAYGRTTEPIPFSFETNRPDEYVVFLVDIDRGRASVMYDMPPVMSSLAFGPGPRVLSAVLAGLAALLLVWAVVKVLVMRPDGRWLDAGCPRCGEHELMRISRHSSDRLLHSLGIPAYRYRCRHCTWEGARLSEEGATVSPGASIARVDLG